MVEKNEKVEKDNVTLMQELLSKMSTEDFNALGGAFKEKAQLITKAQHEADKNARLALAEAEYQKELISHKKVINEEVNNMCELLIKEEFISTEGVKKWFKEHLTKLTADPRKGRVSGKSSMGVKDPGSNPNTKIGFTLNIIKDTGVEGISQANILTAFGDEYGDDDRMKQLCRTQLRALRNADKVNFDTKVYTFIEQPVAAAEEIEK